MKTLIIYDSAYGNTAKIADRLAAAFKNHEEVKTSMVTEFNPEDLTAAELLVVGPPTQGGRPTQNIQEFMHDLPHNALKNKLVAAFDTRFAMKEHGFGLRVLMKTIGFAAPKIADDLKTKGGKLIQEPEGFIVEDKEGPLKNGETERATMWMNTVRRIRP